VSAPCQPFPECALAGLRWSEAELPAVVDRLLRWLPSRRRMGRCVKRSLLLLEVWSRCGLAPTFHYGVGRDAAGARRAHAWLGGVAPDLPTGAPEEGYVETLVV